MLERPRVLSEPPALGATCDEAGAHFAVWSGDATEVELCLYDGHDLETQRVPLQRTDGVFHGHVAGVKAGQRYGFRAHGPYLPERGQRFNPQKLLLDPYARAIDRPARFSPALLGEDPQHPGRPDPRDSAPFVPRSVVVDPSFDWGDDRPPRTKLRDSVIYECHVRGLTALHPEVEPSLRGTFLGLASEPIIAHLQALGVTAVELMPVHQAFSKRRLVDRGRVNYWGYNSVGFFAPDARFRAGTAPEDGVIEIKRMVRALHRAGIEVILDVVYNHTGEADAAGPTLCLRGLGNATYYRLDPADPRRYDDVTGCGNTLDLTQPRTLRLVTDSLRYWVEEVHVDGFRLDLASALVRDAGGPHPERGLCAALLQDPVLSRVKLIAEPWDLGPSGMQLGRFPEGFSEWCSPYRDCVRRFYRGDSGQIGELATRLAGSSDLFAARGRSPAASINYVACHDGLTLRDLTSYARPTDQEPGYEHDGELSCGYGAEGADASDEALALRDRVARSMLATLALSLGVPMLQQGDELGRSQGGMGNPYDRDDDSSYVSWTLGARERSLLAHTQRCFALRRACNALHRDRHFSELPLPGFPALREVSWLRPDGAPMQHADWTDPSARALAMVMLGHDRQGLADGRHPTTLVLLNAGAEPVAFQLPHHGRLRMLLDTAQPDIADSWMASGVVVEGRALCVLEDVVEDDGP